MGGAAAAAIDLGDLRLQTAAIIVLRLRPGSAGSAPIPQTPRTLTAPTNWVALERRQRLHRSSKAYRTSCRAGQNRGGDRPKKATIAPGPTLFHAFVVLPWHLADGANARRRVYSFTVHLAMEEARPGGGGLIRRPVSACGLRDRPVRSCRRQATKNEPGPISAGRCAFAPAARSSARPNAFEAFSRWPDTRRPPRSRRRPISSSGTPGNRSHRLAE